MTPSALLPRSDPCLRPDFIGSGISRLEILSHQGQEGEGGWGGEETGERGWGGVGGWGVDREGEGGDIVLMPSQPSRSQQTDTHTHTHT